MKVAVSCDALVARNSVISIVENILSIYEDAEIYTIVHHEGKIIGPVEQRRIHSTYLTNMITEDTPFGDQWWKKAMFIPGACRNLTVPCNVDLLINITSGFSQAFSKCEGVYQITYLAENKFLERKSKFFREKIFRTYLESWAFKSMKNANELWVTHEKALEYWKDKHPKVSVMSPFFKASDFPLFPEATRKAFPNDFLCIDSETLTKDQAQKLIESLKASNLKFKFVGEDGHLAELKREESDPMFYGSRCAGELAPLLAASRGLLTFQAVGFPTRAAEALSTGTPVWMPKESEGHLFLNGEGVLGKEEGLSDLPGLFEKMATFDLKKVHGQTTQFHDLKFRSEVKRRVDKINLPQHC
ncbi:MAG: hypothetical protein K9K67_10680 [Bacteriovoracaceae bacterium]|nr:hypothetical protein [Bacteriovoracaceae bacterium]